jgi:hypothetical protein
MSAARRIRGIADWLKPVNAAIDRVVQRVSWPGPCSSSVFLITSWTSSAFDTPSAHASTIRALNASAYDVLRRRAHPPST